MKLSIAFQAGEESRAEELLAVICRDLRGRVKIKRTPIRDGYGHVYVAVCQGNYLDRQSGL